MNNFLPLKTPSGGRKKFFGVPKHTKHLYWGYTPLGKFGGYSRPAKPAAASKSPPSKSRLAVARLTAENVAPANCRAGSQGGLFLAARGSDGIK